MDDKKNTTHGPHQGQPIRVIGSPLDRARAAMLMVHGRGASAEDILTLTDDLDVDGFAYLAPQAADNNWYPNRFLAPIESNEPWLSSALELVDDVLNQIRTAGIPVKQTILLGFSQGACLALEYAVRHPQRYGVLVGLSGALIGPDEARQDLTGSLAGTPVFLGCSDEDPHVPKERIQAAADVFRRLGGDPTVRLYPKMAHTVNQDELDFVRSMMQTL